MPTNPTVVFTDVETVTIEGRSVPDPGPEEVLVRSARTLVSTGTELTVLSGDVPPGSAWDDQIEYPFTPGYNNVGTVVEVGDAVESLSEGQRVATYGSHAQYVCAEASACRPAPDTVTDEEATFFTIAEAVNGGRLAPPEVAPPDPVHHDLGDREERSLLVGDSVRDGSAGARLGADVLGV